MAGPTTSSVETTYKGQDVRDLIVQYNKLVDVVANIAQAVTFGMPGAVLTDPGNKTGTTANTAWRTEAFTFTFRGKTTSAAAQEKALTATTHDVAASKEAWYVLTLQTDGTSFTITKAADQTIGTVVMPTAPDNEVIIGYMQIVTGAGGAFDATTHPLTVSNNITAIAFTDAPALGVAAQDAGKVGRNGVAITA